MKKTNALKLRQSLGKILKELQKDGEPILVEKDRKPAAVLVSLRDFKKRFADKDAEQERERVIAIIRSAKLKALPGKSAADLVLELRS